MADTYAVTACQVETEMSAVLKRPTCGSCDCYRPDPKQLMQGFCHCLPPTPILIPGPGGAAVLASYRPPVQISEFCHQWRPPLAAANAVPTEAAGASPAQESEHGAEKDRHHDR